jgi:hypothetical protein
MILEGQADPGAVSHNFSVLDFHVEFLDLRNSQILEGLVCGLNGIPGSLLPLKKGDFPNSVVGKE